MPIEMVKTLTRWLGLEFYLLTSDSVHAEVLRCAICLPTLLLKAQAVFVLELIVTLD